MNEDFEEVMRVAFAQAKVCKSSKNETARFFDYRKGEEYCILTVEQMQLLKDCVNDAKDGKR